MLIRYLTRTEPKLPNGMLVSRSQPAPSIARHRDAPHPEPHPELHSLVETITHLVRGQKYTDALTQIDTLLQQAIVKGDKIGQAYGHYFRAQVLQRLRHWDEAQAAWAQVAQLWDAAGERAFVTEALLERAFCLWHHSNTLHRSTIEALVNLAVKTALSEQRRPIHVAQRLHEASDRWQDECLELEIVEALRFAALNIYQNYRPKSPEEANSWYKLGALESYRSNLEKEFEYYMNAFEIYKALNHVSYGFGWAAIKVGDVLEVWGDYEEAQYYYEIAVEIFLKLGDPKTAPYHALGIVARKRNDWAKAWEHFNKALQIQEEDNPYSTHVVANLNNLEMVATAMRLVDKAREFYERALMIAQSGQVPPEQKVNVLNTVGSMAARRGDLETARILLQEALDLHQQQASEGIERAALLHHLSVLHLKLGEIKSAKEHAMEALQIYQRFSPRGFRTVRCLETLSMIAIKEGNTRDAIEYLSRASRIIDDIHRQIFYSEGRIYFREGYFDTHIRLAFLYLLNRQFAKAVEMLERSRACSLAETLQQRRQLRRDLPKPLQQLLAQLDQLDNQRLRLHHQQRQANSEAIPDQLRQRERELNRQQRVIAHRLHREFPDFAGRFLPLPLTLQQIQQSLDPGTVLLYHALVEDQLLIVAVSRNQVNGFASQVDRELLEDDIKAFYRLVSRAEDHLPDGILPPRFKSEQEGLTKFGHKLYTQLIAPMQGMLQNARRVLLCPDGVLSQLPWAALIVKVHNGKPVYWIEQVALHLTPSVGVYRQARAVRPATHGVVVAAVSKYGGRVDLARNRRSVVAMLLRRSKAGTVLQDLTNASKEVQQLRQMFGTQVRVLENEYATPVAVKELARGARVVHFICHARADNVNPLGSALLLAPAGAPAGLLTAGDVLMSWKLQADLVMLSACETGVGVARRYEGVYSLGRAFLVAGSRSVGMSLWQVSDEATAELMRGFYERYVRGVAKDVALREAQLELLRSNRYTDPYFWSAFVLMGDYR